MEYNIKWVTLWIILSFAFSESKFTGGSHGLEFWLLFNIKPTCVRFWSSVRGE